MTAFLSIEDLCLSIQDTNLSDVEEAAYDDLMGCEFETEERHEEEFRSLLCSAQPSKTTAKSVDRSQHVPLFLDTTKEECPMTTDKKLANSCPFSTFTAQDRKTNGWNRAETNEDNSSSLTRSTHKRQKQRFEEIRVASTLSKPVCNSCYGKENSLEEVFDPAARQKSHMNRVTGNPVLLKEKTSVSQSLARQDLSTSRSTITTRPLPVVSSRKCELGKFCLPELSNYQQVHENKTVQYHSFECGGDGEVPFSARIAKCIEFEFSLLKGKKCIESEQNNHSWNSPTATVSVEEEPLFASKDWEPFESDEESYCGKRRKLKERPIRGANEFDSLMKDHTP